MPASLSEFLHRFYRAVRRVIPRGITQTQAIAFNMFLSFSPMILVILGTLAGSAAFREAIKDIIARMRIVLPPGTMDLLNAFLSRHNAHPWQWVLLGLGGTLLAGTQMMKLLMEGIRIVYHDPERQSIASRHIRALLLLSATLIPAIFSVNLVIFGRQLRIWMLHFSGMPVFIRWLWSGVYVVTPLLIVMFMLSVIYRVSRPGRHRWQFIVPGAAVATVLWWVVSIALGFYLRHVSYSIIYGGLAVTIGLMLWMQLTSTILLIGAAYNAELHDASN
ncbi:MAG TPA: YihY/virulence factor BrkB family protein [Candidatus Dormibacteraeota bacterium]|nr:YihY/virulence factor BrkB family protein [Candidatus Dormibacteraeota bacterium]